MGAGILDAEAINVGYLSVGSMTQNSTFTATDGGTVKVETLTLGQRNNGTQNSTFNLNGGATLAAETIKNGSGSATRTFNWNDGTISNYDADTGLTVSSALTLVDTGLHAFDISSGQTGTINGNITSTAGTLTKTGAGDLALSSTMDLGSGKLHVTDGSMTINNYKFTIGSGQISGGTLILRGTAANTVNKGNWIVDGGTLQVGLETDNSGNLFGSNQTGNIQLSNNGTLLFKRYGSADLIKNQITGSGTVINEMGYDGSLSRNSLTQSGSGTIDGDVSFVQNSEKVPTILSLANTYTGATTVSAGTLLVTGSLGNTAVSVAADAVLGGTGSIGGSVDFATGSLFEVMNLNTPLTVSGNVSFGEGFGIANLRGINWSSVALGAYTIIDTDQDFSEAGLDNFGIDNAATVDSNRWAYFTNGSLQLVIIPEPGTLSLLGGLGALALLRRRRG